MTQASFAHFPLEDLKVLSEALTQFVDNQCEIATEERGGESADVIRARALLEAAEQALVARLGVAVEG